MFVDDDVDAALDARADARATWTPRPSHRGMGAIDARRGTASPTSGREAEAHSAVIARSLVNASVDVRRLERALVSAESLTWAQRKGAKTRFADVGTGTRCRYRACGTDDRVVIVLHDVGECGDVYYGLIEALGDRGYRAYALDMRGHGETSRSSEGRYAPKDLAADVEAFIVELDLYVRPVAIVGFGLGGVVAVELAKMNPRLVASTVLVECSPLAPRDAYSFFPLQASAYVSVDDAVRALLSPSLAENERYENRHLRQVCGRALQTLTPGSQRLNLPVDVDIWTWRVDPEFYCPWNPDDLWDGIETNECHFALIYGEHSSRVRKSDANAIVNAASERAKSSRAYVVVDASRRVLEDAPSDSLDMIAYALMRADDDMMVKNKQARTPEALGIRPLPQYATLEDAIKALAPRPVPTEAQVAEALRLARLDDEVASDDDDSKFNNRTKLIQNDPEYFGFVG